MPLYNFSGTNEGIVKMCPPCRGLIQKTFDQLFRSASGVILNNDLKGKSGMDLVAASRVPLPRRSSQTRRYCTCLGVRPSDPRFESPPALNARTTRERIRRHHSDYCAEPRYDAPSVYSSRVCDQYWSSKSTCRVDQR